jgi:hypothetical protein
MTTRQPKHVTGCRRTNVKFHHVKMSLTQVMSGDINGRRLRGASAPTGLSSLGKPRRVSSLPTSLRPPKRFANQLVYGTGLCESGSAERLGESNSGRHLRSDCIAPLVIAAGHFGPDPLACNDKSGLVPCAVARKTLRVSRADGDCRPHEVWCQASASLGSANATAY